MRPLWHSAFALLFSVLMAFATKVLFPSGPYANAVSLAVFILTTLVSTHISLWKYIIDLKTDIAALASVASVDIVRHPTLGPLLRLPAHLERALSQRVATRANLETAIQSVLLREIERRTNPLLQWGREFTVGQIWLDKEGLSECNCEIALAASSLRALSYGRPSLVWGDPALAKYFDANTAIVKHFGVGSVRRIFVLPSIPKRASARAVSLYDALEEEDKRIIETQVGAGIEVRIITESRLEAVADARYRNLTDLVIFDELVAIRVVHDIEGLSTATAAFDANTAKALLAGHFNRLWDKAERFPTVGENPG